ncbi:MAG: DUF4445 domain-containing protein [Anaerolineae bacterium]|jgi:uncharacterized 2Fe-2S/4Fe-4S cluster protein (DUF4445 family)|nr:DUF4445 domain-containing protein [Anaerolineae bacterium]MBT7071966.1 DUF4445 domain-containing protein [Anaerolineae bacterium]MBT7325000.1 DUF4445 domain-containing protein [Anaerolineae bacterium]
MSQVSIIYGEEKKVVEATDGEILGDVIASLCLPIEQPCAGLGTCGRCKILVESGGNAPDETERKHLTAGELAVGTRLACRARIDGDTQAVLSPIVVYSNKIFKASNRYRRDPQVPLGLAIDLGSTTVAAYLTMLDNGEVVAGGASLNQQRVYGADIISRLSAAMQAQTQRQRLHRLAVSSINQAINSLKLSTKLLGRIQRISIVGNVAMHHLLANFPVDTLGTMPFQPFTKEANKNAKGLLRGIVDDNVQIMLPPVIGGFVGSDTLACLAYFDFDQANIPMLAVDLGTNGEVLLTDGNEIVVASTAAGPAFEGVNISCGMRAVDGAIVDASLKDGRFFLTTIGDEVPRGLTGSGLIKVVNELVLAGIIEKSGRITHDPNLMPEMIDRSARPTRIFLTPERDVWLNQKDIREFQKAKGAIRAAIDILLESLNLKKEDLQKVILTGSFGGQLDIESVIRLGMLPEFSTDVVSNIPNGAGMGAAIFLSDDGFSRGERIAASTKQIDLDQATDFHELFVASLKLAVN